MRAAVLTSTALRHTFFLQVMAQAFPVAVAVRQPKKNNDEAAHQQSHAICEHFARLGEAETAEFRPRLTGAPLPEMQVVDEINSEDLVARVRRADVDVVLLFGTVILKEIWLRAFPDRIVNLHLGLSPFYRGAATLFWPFVNGELECVGATIHLATERVDAGAILRRIKADPQVGDTYYTLTTRLIRRSVEAMPNVVYDYLSGAARPQAQTGAQTRAYRRRDFNETVLAQALAFVGGGLTRAQIENAGRSTKCTCSP
jgi:methionyl-tRNA formyltransferase